MTKGKGNGKTRGFLKPYGTYMFRDKDPEIDRLRTLKADGSFTDTYIHEVSGVSATTLGNWWHGKTKRPQNASIEAVGRAMGKRRDWVDLGKAELARFSARTKRVLKEKRR